MICKNCGAELAPGTRICGRCGDVVNINASVSESDYPTVAVPRGEVGNANKSDIAQKNKLLSRIWPDWMITERIGSGSYGDVYKAERSEMGNKFYSAIKIIPVPKNTAEIDNAAENGFSPEQYFQSVVEDCMESIKLQVTMKGTQNIVSIEDFKVVSHAPEFGWSILIRMELLTSLNSYLKRKGQLSEKEVVKLGSDICSALERCASINVMHRDIKQENLFITDSGDFKLGDFGIACKLEKTTAGLSTKGTFYYMAPEVSRGDDYGFNADVYSLGIVMYKLLNNNNFPLENGNVTPQQRENAFKMRANGAALPKPVNASDALASVILTACAYDPNRRFMSASALKVALQKVYDTPVSAPVQSTGFKRQVAAAAPTPTPTPTPTPAPAPKPKKPKKKMSKGKKALTIILTVLIVMLGTAGYVGLRYLTGDEYKIIKALNNEDYSQAYEIYQTGLEGGASRTLIFSLQTRLDKVREDFDAGAIEYSVANMEVSTIEKMNISDIAAKVKEVKEHISALNTSRTAFSTAETMMTKGDFEGAITNYKKVTEDDTNYETAKSKLANAVEQYRAAILKSAADYVAQNSYDKAIACIEGALKVLPDDAKLTEQLEIHNKNFKEQTKSTAVSSAKAAADKGDYQSALKTLSDAMKNFPDDVDITTDYKTYSAKFSEDAIKKADEVTAQKNYTGAIELLTDALKVLPSDEALTKKLAEVEAAQPVSLSTLTPINGSLGKWNEGSPTDPFGQTHTQVSNYIIVEDGTRYEEYRLYGKYKTLSGSLVPYKDMPTDGSAQVKIYADDKLIYTSPTIGRKTDTVDFEINIQGADYIKIETSEANGRWRVVDNLIVMNMQLWADK